MRLDKWLWAARFFKTRGLAVEAIERDRVRVNDAAIKPAREVRPDDRISLRGEAGVVRTVVVRGLSAVRGPATVAQQLYEETPESVLAREAAATHKRLAPEPAADLRGGRPTKHDRRAMERTTGWERWSASIDEPPRKS